MIHERNCVRSWNCLASPLYFSQAHAAPHHGPGLVRLRVRWILDRFRIGWGLLLGLILELTVGLQYSRIDLVLVLGRVDLELRLRVGLEWGQGRLERQKPKATNNHGQKAKSPNNPNKQQAKTLSQVTQT